MSAERLPPLRRVTHALAVPVRRFLEWKWLRAGLATDAWNAERLRAYHDTMLRRVVQSAARHIPFYQQLYRQADVDVAGFRGVADLPKLPMIQKTDLLEHAQRLRRPGVPGWLTGSVNTGGSSGQVATIWFYAGTSGREMGSIACLWQRVGARWSDRMAVLRGLVPSRSGANWEYDRAARRLILSSYRITADGVREFIALMKQYRIQWLHAYPTSALLMANVMASAGIGLEAPLRGVLLASESVFAGQPEYCEQVFGCPVYAHYGHREIVLLAGWCPGSREYHFLPNYGFVEFVPTGTAPPGCDQMYELVGTRYMDQYMPLIRYRTNDFAAPSEPGPCHACGRWHVRAKTIYGRGQELLVGRGGVVIPVVNINASFAYRHARRFQFKQDEPGKVDYLFVPVNLAQVESAVTELEANFASLEQWGLRARVVPVAELPATPNAKDRIVARSIPLPWEPQLMETKVALRGCVT